MIARLKGILERRSTDWLILDVGGVGYHVFASSRTLSALPAHGGEIALEIETHVREDHIHLYGFATLAERDWFRLLTSVQGVGAKVGLAILSSLTPDQLTNAVAAADKGMIARANGVGPKLAARIATELKDKVGTIAQPTSYAAPNQGNATVQPIDPVVSATEGAGDPPAMQLRDDAVSALVNLGFARSDAYGCVAEILLHDAPPPPLPALIKTALQRLNHQSGGRHG